MSDSTRQFAVITGGSSGIGLALAKQFLTNGFDILIAADTGVSQAAETLRHEAPESNVEELESDLSTEEGISTLYDAIQATGRSVDALAANAGIGAGESFFDEPRSAWSKVIETNITGTLDIVHRIGRDMRSCGQGRILITSSIASHTPSPFLAVYSASKAFLQSFAAAIRNELQDSGVTVTALLPGATDTQIWDRAAVTDTKLGGSDSKDDPDAVAKTGFTALMAGEASVVHGFINKAAMAAANLLPDSVLAAVARRTTEPGSR
jgi:short-subunit dehydrogenase